MNEEQSINRNIPVPLYYQIKSMLLSDIQNGIYSLGEQIPTEFELQARYQVSRSTIRQALNDLANDGWLVRKSSKGTFVTNPSQAKSVFHSFEPFHSLVNRSGKTPRTEVLDLNVTEASKYIADSMNFDMGEKVIMLFRRRFIDNEPIVTVRNYLPYSLCSFILDYDLNKQSLYELLMQNSVSRIKTTKTIVSAEKSKAEDVNFLSVKLDCPMLVFNNTSVSDNDTIVDFAFLHYRGDLSNFEIESSPT